MGKKKVKNIVDTTYDASKDEKLKAQNSFLVVCVCSILFILVLCYFGINSFKGTSAAEAPKALCLNNRTLISNNGNNYCCPAGYETIKVIDGKNYCVDLEKEGKVEYVGNNSVEGETPSDESVCPSTYGSSFRVYVADDWQPYANTVLDSKEGSCGYHCGAWSGGTANCYKVCKFCYSTEHVVETPVNTNTDGYCIKDISTGAYSYGKVSNNINASNYKHVSQYYGDERGCLGNNRPIISVVYNNHQSKYVESNHIAATAFNAGIPESKKITTVADSNGVSGLIIEKNGIDYYPKFLGWKLIKKSGNVSFAESKETIATGTWKPISEGAVVTDTMFRYLNVEDIKTTVLEAQWEELKIQLPTVETVDGKSCKWNTKADGSGLSYESGSIYTTTSETPVELKVYAICDTSGTSTPTPGSVPPDDRYVCFSGPAEGWYWDLYGEHKNDPNYHYYETMDWLACRLANGGSFDPDSYMPGIVVDANGGYIKESDDINGWTPTMKTYGKGCLISGTNTTCSVSGEVEAVFRGKTFKGWGESKSCTSGKKVSEYSISNNITLYACWAEGVSAGETDDVAVDILLDANGGYIKESDEISGWTSTMTTYTKSCLINSNKPACSVGGEVEAVLSGKTFKGWGPSKDCTSGKKVSEYSVSKDTTLYACWVSSSTGGGGTGTQISKPTNSLCKSNLKYTGSSQNITSATSGTGYTLSGYKQTDAGTYTVTASLVSGYEWNDGSDGTTSFKCSISKASPNVTLSKSSLTVNEGEETTFTEKANIAGSFSNVSGKTNVATINPGSYSNVSANTTRTVSVVGVAAGTSVVKVTFTPTDTKNYNSTDVSLTVRVNGSSSTVAPSTYTITYNKNGGEGSMNTSSCTYGSSCTLRANTFTRDGYTFVGWTTTPSSSLVVYSDGQSFTYDRDANLTLYAVWSSGAGGGDTPVTYTATFNPNNGTLSGQGTLTCDTTSNSCEVTGLPTANRSGYTFKGWGENSSCSTGNSSKLTLTKDTTFYACWQSNSTSNPGGGEIKNPQTGEGMIVFVALLGVAAISYLVYYYKRFQKD